jgi:putative FmdB family regulatory protein
MPTYEYLCPDGHEFDLFQKMSDKPRAKCPTCGKVATRKISGGAGLVFKGSGFYITDYGKDGKGPRKEGEKPPAEQATGDKAPGEKPVSDKPTAPAPSPKPDKPTGKKKASSE